MKKHTKILVVVLFLFAAFALFASMYIRKEKGGEVVITPQNQGTSTPEGAFTVQAGTTTASQKPSMPAPALARSIPATSPDLDSTGRTRALSDLGVVISNLKENPYSYQDWIYLGLLRQMLSDYVGAEMAWNYATKLIPREPVAFMNLGNLYMLYIKNSLKSETNYKTAISLDPKNTNNYRSLFELYTYYYKKGTTAGENILKEGILKNPKSYDLGVLLARLYLDQHRIAEAKAAFTAAADMATQAGKSDIAATIKAEGDAIK